MNAGMHLLMRAGERLCALDLARVREILRPLPTTPLPADDPAVIGASVLRGEACPVLDLAVLIGAKPGPVARWVAVAGAQRTLALAVTEVLGVRRLPEAATARWAVDEGRTAGFARWGGDVVILLRALIEAPAAS